MKFHSMLLQSICDHKKKKLIFCIKVVHLRISKLWQKLQTSELPHKNHFKIGSKDIQPYLLGGSTYPLQIGLMKSFSSKATCIFQQNLFDREWRVGRVKI